MSAPAYLVNIKDLNINWHFPLFYLQLVKLPTHSKDTGPVCLHKPLVLARLIIDSICKNWATLEEHLKNRSQVYAQYAKYAKCVIWKMSEQEDVRGHLWHQRGSLISGSQSPSPPPSTDAKAEMDRGNTQMGKKWGVLESSRELVLIVQRKVFIVSHLTQTF